MQKILSETSCAEVVAPQAAAGLVSARKGEGLKQVALRMAAKRISALPVFDDNNKLLGLLDFGDIVSFIIHASEKRPRGEGALANSHAFWEFLQHTLVSEDLVNCSKSNESREILGTASVREACELFANNTAIKRLLVVDADNKLIGLLSPSALSRHALAKLKGAMDPVLMQTVNKLDLGSSARMETVPKTCLLIDAMIKMLAAGVSCVAVVDAQNAHVLCGSVSLSDIKMVFAPTEDFSLLQMTCWDTIVLSRSLQVSDEKYPFFGVGPESTLFTVIGKLHATHVHNMYVVDKTQKPIQVINYTAVCRALLSG